MSTTLTMWLGIAFVVIGIVASILQAWLWSFPMEPDPGGPDPNGKSTAPRSWTNVHRLLGAAFVVIYVVLMVEMVPRLWEYQVELPARTIMHAVMGITIGFLLVCKIAIIRWFQHFGKALPQIGAGILLCTIILAFLSIPYSIQAHSFGDVTRADNLARVERVLQTAEYSPAEAAELATEDGLSAGREVLVSKCVYCHDLRTILRKPRSAKQWKSVTIRMMEKPTLKLPILDEDVGPVTAYLVAITPDLRDSIKKKKEEDEKQAEMVQKVQAAKSEGGDKADKPAFDEAKAKALYEDACSQCHELSDVDDYGPQTYEGWLEVSRNMVTENDAEISEQDLETIATYLAKVMGKK